MHNKLPKYTGSFVSRRFSLINLATLIANILRCIGLLDWYSSWDSSTYFLTFIINLFFLKLTFYLPVKLKYHKNNTIRTFGKPLKSSTLKISIFDKNICIFTNNPLLWLANLIVRTQLTNMVQYVLADNNKKNTTYFDYDRNIITLDLSSKIVNPMDLYEFYVLRDDLNK